MLTRYINKIKIFKMTDRIFESQIDPGAFQKRASLDSIHSLSLHLNCGKCNRIYKNPKILPCMHYFCQSCIEGTMVKHNVLECYLCHEATPCSTKISDLMTTHYPLVDLIQLKKLRDNLKNGPKEVCCVNCSFGKDNTPAVCYCCDCREIMCRHDKKAHDRYKPSHRSIPIEQLLNEIHLEKLLSDISTVKCGTHPKQDIKYFCVDCDDKICDDCGFVEHNTHKKTFLKAALNLSGESVDQKMDELEKPGSAFSDENYKFDEQKQQMEAKRQVTIDRITKHFSELIQTLEARRETLITHVNCWYSVLRDQLYTTCDKQSTLVKKIANLGDFVSHYREYPNNYKIELTPVINRRFAALKSSMPKIPLQIKPIEYDRGFESEVESQIDNIGWLKYLHKTNLDNPIKYIARADLLPENTSKEAESGTVELQGIAEGNNNRLYVFSSQYSESEAKNRCGKDTCQIFDSQFNIIESVTCPSIMQNSSQILIGRGQDSSIYILERDLKHIIIRDEYFKRTIRCISADDINSIQDPSSITLTSRSLLVVHNRSMNELVFLDKDFIIDKRFPLKPLPLKRKESPLSRADSVQKIGNRGKKLNIPEKEQRPASQEPSIGSVTIAVDTKDNIFVLNEDKALITIYNFEGKEVGELNFQDRLRHLDDNSGEKKQGAQEIEQPSKEKALTRKSTTTNVNSIRTVPTTPQKRPSSAKPVSRPDTLTPPISQQPSRSFLTIDSLDNIYVVQRNWLIAFDPQQRFIGATKLAFEPSSLIVNKSGYVYVMSDKGDVNVYN